MTRGELNLAWAYDRVLYHGLIPVKVKQLCSPWSKAETVVVKSVKNPKGRTWKCSFSELSAIPIKEEAA